MSFLVRFIIVIVWMVSISASSFAVTKRCTKTDKAIPHHIIKTSQKTAASPIAANKSEAICTGGMSLYCIQYKGMFTLPSLYNQIIYPRFIEAISLSGFSKIPYSPPRYILNI